MGRIITLYILKAHIDFHPSLRVASGLLRILKQTFGEHLMQFCNSTLPVISKNEEGAYELVARQHIYDFLVYQANEDTQVNFYLINDDEFDGALKMDNAEIDLLLRAGQNLPATPAALSHQKHRKSGMVCPFCSNVLQGPKGKKSVQSGPNQGYYKVTCLGKFHEQPPCDFKAYLSKEEISNFWKRTYPTIEWLKRTDKLCDQCGKPLYLRTRGDKSVLMCEDSFRESGTCKFHKNP